MLAVLLAAFLFSNVFIGVICRYTGVDAVTEEPNQAQPLPKKCVIEVPYTRSSWDQGNQVTVTHMKRQTPGSEVRKSGLGKGMDAGNLYIYFHED
jgi:hypothetical protein